jgi:hypothetical protein
LYEKSKDESPNELALKSLNLANLSGFMDETPLSKQPEYFFCTDKSSSYIKWLASTRLCKEFGYKIEWAIEALNKVWKESTKISSSEDYGYYDLETICSDSSLENKIIEHAINWLVRSGI